MEIQAEMSDELSLQDKITAAHVAFHSACGPGEKRMRWRALAELIRRREENREHESEGITG